jgi:hypothetical protein
MTTVLKPADYPASPALSRYHVEMGTDLSPLADGLRYELVAWRQPQPPTGLM